MDELIDISKASELLGVSTKTLRRWDNEGKLKAYRTIGNHRRYKIKDIENLLGEINQNTQKNVFIYCRVSTKKQADSGNLQRQKERLIQYCNEKQYNIVHVFEEVASGLNDKRRELIKMLRRLNEVNSIIIEYPDRFASFGYNYLQEFCKSLNVSIEAIQQNDKLQPNKEMVNDLISIVTCFSARLYGARGGRKVKKDIQKSIKEIEEKRDENSEDNNKSDFNK